VKATAGIGVRPVGGSVDGFLDQNNKEHRHLIDFEATSEKDGFIGAPGVEGPNLGNR
jgi:hypothetical protein